MDESEFVITTANSKVKVNIDSSAKSSDVDGNGVINMVDIQKVTDNFSDNASQNSNYDLNNDGKINNLDLKIVTDSYQ